MPDYFGIDTSNYTTSVAVYRSEENKIYQEKKLLPVKKSQLGLRQSDAVFRHTKQLPEIIQNLSNKIGLGNLEAITASTRPRNIEGSYMPCFLCGEGLALSISIMQNIDYYKTSHQVGHILSALYSADRLDLVNEKFIAFHLSGGTTECLLCQPDDENIIDISMISKTLDLKAGQAIDRVGVAMGLDFPCGKELEKLALKSEKNYTPKPVLKELDCCLSGLENKCIKMLDDGENNEDIAKFCLQFIGVTVIEMTSRVLEKYGDLPVIYAGGVMSNSIIRDMILKKYNAMFAQPQFSCDNAAGVALYGYYKETRR